MAVSILLLCIKVWGQPQSNPEIYPEIRESICFSWGLAAPDPARGSKGSSGMEGLRKRMILWHCYVLSGDARKAVVEAVQAGGAATGEGFSRAGHHKGPHLSKCFLLFLLSPGEEVYSFLRGPI